jgi:hypothetical protein
MRTRIVLSILVVILSLMVVMKSCETSVSVAHAASARILTEKDFDLGRQYTFDTGISVHIIKTVEGWLIKARWENAAYAYVPDPGHNQQWIVYD